jgi:hypothetical protein
LCQSGDLEVDTQSRGYKLAPKALTTLAEHVKEEQRHLDTQNAAKKTRALTMAIVVIGLLNLGFQMGKFIYDNWDSINPTTKRVTAFEYDEKSHNTSHS